jgi:hypothetical protein
MNELTVAQLRAAYNTPVNSAQPPKQFIFTQPCSRAFTPSSHQTQSMDSSKEQQGSGAQPKSTSEAAPDIKNSTSPEVQAMRGPDTLAAAVQVSLAN